MNNQFILSILISTLIFCSCEKSNLPVVETLAYEVVSLSAVVFTGEVSDESGSAVINRGFVWGTHQNPTISDYFSENEFGPGAFSTKAENLECKKEYFFRSYALNANGVGYGKSLSFTISGPEMGTMTDPRDGKSYSTVTIVNQTWMADNLAFLPAVSPGASESFNEPFYYVNGYDGENVGQAKSNPYYEAYGVLYNWSAAMARDSGSTLVPSGIQGVCPDGWHLPSDGEWTLLTGYLGSDAFTKMKSTKGWFEGLNGDNSSGFNARPGGARVSGQWVTTAGTNGATGEGAYFWSTTSTNGWWGAWNRYLAYNDYYEYYNVYEGVRRWDSPREQGLSVRCLKN